MAMSQARSKPSLILRGWIPLSSRVRACSRSWPARTTTPVVPSPTSLSWDWESSTSSLAVGCCISLSIGIRAYHLLNNGGAVVGDRDIAIGGHKHLVHALGAERGAQGVSHGLGRKNIAFVSLEALKSLLGLLLTEDDVGSSEVVECQTHFK